MATAVSSIGANPSMTNSNSLSAAETKRKIKLQTSSYTTILDDYIDGNRESKVINKKLKLTKDNIKDFLIRSNEKEICYNGTRFSVVKKNKKIPINFKNLSQFMKDEYLSTKPKPDGKVVDGDNKENMTLTSFLQKLPVLSKEQDQDVLLKLAGDIVQHFLKQFIHYRNQNKTTTMQLMIKKIKESSS